MMVKRTLVPSALAVLLAGAVGCGGSAPVARESAPVAATPAALPIASAEPSTSPVAALVPSEPPVAEAPPPPPLPEGTMILHVGDSFVHSGLTQALKPKFKALGAKYEVRAEHSTNSMDWAKRVPGLVAAIRPDLVIVTLGGNEIGSKWLDVEANAVGRIVAAIGDRPCIWTTPPLWREEEGVFDTIAKSLGHCRFFETDVQVGTFIPRRDDKIHPTAEGGAMWAEALYGYLVRERAGAPLPWSLKDGPPDEKATKGKRNALPH
ncbi:MAG: SGNH/GDSL hydrolase family protein [Polyangiaceae bacterium]